jgi:hypothetical protein
MEVYRPVVLPLQRLCAVVVKKNTNLLSDHIDKLPLILKEYVKETRPGIVYTGIVDIKNERTMAVWLDLYAREKYERLAGKNVYQCLRCERIDYCWMFLDKFEITDFCMFPGSPTPICYCCHCPAFFIPPNYIYWY